MAEKLFTQDDLNRIVASRVKRERDRLTKEYENSLKRCMAAVHLVLHQEMCATMKGEVAAETKDLLGSGPCDAGPDERPAAARSQNPAYAHAAGGGENL